MWIAAMGLMLASSGIDGAYMARWMDDAQWLGYVLNTTADITGLILMYWYGRLRQFPKNTKRHKMAAALLPAEIVAVAYSWFFSWRQLLLVLPNVEGSAAAWVAPLSAGFIPLLNAFIGYAQALLSGRIERESKSTSEAQARASEARVKGSGAQASISKAGASSSEAQAEAQRADAPLACEYCGAQANASGEPFRSQQAVSAHKRFCDAYQKAQANGGSK